VNGAAAAISSTATAAATSAKALGSRAVRGTALSLAGQLASQIIRLGSNLILTRLLDPDAFGLMAIVLSVTTGLSLVSDVGVWQAIVRSPHGDDEEFLDSAWTFHAVRGIGLFMIGLALAYPASRFYGRAELFWLLPLASFSAVLQGVESTKTAQESRHLRLGKITVMELVTQVVGLAFSITLGVVYRSVVALVVASLASSLLRTLMSHFFLPGRLNRVRWDKRSLDEIFRFGRFIFLSTIFYFIGTRYDVFALGRLEGMTVIGVYWQAVNITNVPAQMGERVTYSVLMPALSERFRESPARFAADVRRARLILLPAAAVLFLGAAMTAPAFFKLVYRDVYVDAGWMVQLLVLNAWCMFLQESNARALMTFGDTAPLAVSNGVRVAISVVATLLGFHFGGQLDANYGPLIGFMLGNALGAFFGNLTMATGLARRGADVRLIDVVATGAFVAVAVVGCGVPILVERATHAAPAAYTTLISVVVLLGPSALWVARRTRDALREQKATS
jgi:O-antigen/teichoic acid export membrane protein